MLGAPTDFTVTVRQVKVSAGAGFLIAEAARLHADYFLNRDNETAWKVCTHCGQRKLRDTREFMRKAKSSDGLASRCKKCESKVRAERKAAKTAK